MAHGNEISERAASWHGLEYRSPFLDRRMMEFGYAIPERQRCRDGLSKFVLRNGARDLLPESVQRRRTKADFAFVIADAFAALSQAECSNFRGLADMGWVDAGAARGAMRASLDFYARRDVRYMKRMWSIWSALAVEMWLSGQAAGRIVPVRTEASQA
jgi:asparagine synthase (glutamine-hydrolysing)